MDLPEFSKLHLTSDPWSPTTSLHRSHLMTTSTSEPISISASPLKRTHSWPPSQWYLDRFTEQAESPTPPPDHPATYEDQDLGQEGPSSHHLWLDRLARLSIPDHDSSATTSETSSVKAASHKAVAGSTFPSTSQLSPHPSLYGGSRSGLARRSSASQQKLSFRESHFKRWSRDMSRTSKKMAKHAR